MLKSIIDGWQKSMVGVVGIEPENSQMAVGVFFAWPFLEGLPEEMHLASDQFGLTNSD